MLELLQKWAYHPYTLTPHPHIILRKMAGALPVLKHILISIKDENMKNAWLEKVDMHFK